MLYRNKLNRIVCVLAALFLLAPLLSPRVFAADKGDIVFVGANPDFGIEKASSLSYYGLADDYLRQIKKRTGHRYTYVDGTPEELFEMLLDRKISVIPCVTEKERELYADLIEENGADKTMFAEYSILTKFSAVYIRDGADGFDLFDTEALRSARVGYLAENETEYFRDGEFVFGELQGADFVKYNTESQMRTDFFAGKLDAVAKSCFRPWGNEAIVYQFDTAPCYFLVSASDKELCTQLGEALGGVCIADPGVSGIFYEKYISSFGAQKYALTASEKQFIADNPELVMAYNLGADMVEIYDNNGKTIIGPTGEIIRIIEESTGIHFTIKPCSNLADCMKLLQSGEADVVAGGVNMDSVSSFGSVFVSVPYSRIPVVIAGKKGSVLSDRMKIAMAGTKNDMSTYASHLYPNATFMPYDNLMQCADAVMAGEADVLCAEAFEFISIRNSDYHDLEIIGTSASIHAECIAMRPESIELQAIIAKSLTQISNNNAMVLTYESLSSLRYESMTLTRFVDKYLWIIISVLAVLFIGAVVLVVMTVVKNRRAAETDHLTGGRTKQKFLDDSAKAIRRSSPEKWAIVLFDIDKFKYVNDRLGYEEGDRMLVRLFKTISDNLDDDEVFARTADDNFACTVHNMSDTELTQKINLIFSEFERRNSIFVKYPVFFSAGICRLGQCTDTHGMVDLNAALDRCNIAKKTLKSFHNSSIAFYDGKIRDKALREKDFENIMPTALAEHEFECWLQPKYGLKSLHIEGAEALIRWNSKEFGFVYPDEFIPLSEKNGFVVELDFFILEEVCKSMRRWMDSGRTPVVISVNQSRLHLNYDDYIWRLREIVDKYEIPYEYIELELTETVFAENAELLIKVMQKLHEIGFKLSIDDFGSGYSSLNMMKDVPADVVKIDREFFNGTVNSQKGRAVISTVVDLAKNLNMQVISEGVETLEQVEFLTEINCAMVQGYYFAKPMPISSFEKLWFEDLAKKESEKAAK